MALTPPPVAGQLEAFLAKPLRPLRGLLDPNRLERADRDHYLYTSRPYIVAGLYLQPRVTLRAQFCEGELLIEQVGATIQGLGAWQERLRFGLEARLRAGADALDAEALVWTEIPALAAPIIQPLVELGLQQTLDRMEQRCQHRLRRKTESWLARLG